MLWTQHHGRLLGKAFERVLRHPEAGALAYTCCLPPVVLEKLVQDDAFKLRGWEVRRVADEDDTQRRTITADTAVELREDKGPALLLLVDVIRAGAGMDGIYSAAREVGEADLFHSARILGLGQVTKVLSAKERRYAERAIGKAHAVSPWTKFDFLCRVVAQQAHPGRLLHVLGLWPISRPTDEVQADLDLSMRFVERLFGVSAANLTVPARIESLRLAPETTGEQKRSLRRFINDAASQPLISALSSLSNKETLWIGSLRRERVDAIRAIDLKPWRTVKGKIAKWSGLADNGDDPPEFRLKPESGGLGDYSSLEVRWRAKPANLQKHAADYRIAVMADDEELASSEIPHSGRQDQKCRFSIEDFPALDEDARVSAKVVVSVIGNDQIREGESEEFYACVGEAPEKSSGGAGVKVRAFSEA